MGSLEVHVGIDVSKARLDVALTACTCKLLTILNAMLKHQTPWGYVVPGYRHHALDIRDSC